MRSSHMMEGQHKAQGMDRILNKGYQQPPRFQYQHQGGEGKNDYQGHRRTQPFEEPMLQFMGDKKRLIHFHEQKLYDFEAFKYDTQVFQKNTSVSLKNMETQVGQLAISMPNQSKGTFPSDTQNNPKDYMAVQLRSRKQMGNNSKKERKEETDVEQEETGKEGEKRMPEKTTEAKKKIRTEQPEGSSEHKQKEKVPTYTPTVPFPQRLQKGKREEQLSRFLDIFKKIEINIQFA